VERFCFRGFLVSSGLLLLWFLSMTFANEFVIGIHAKFLGITENNILQFEYDARMTMYLLMGAFKLGLMLFFFHSVAGAAAWAHLKGGELVRSTSANELR